MIESTRIQFMLFAAGLMASCSSEQGGADGSDALATAPPMAAAGAGGSGAAGDGATRDADAGEVDVGAADGEGRDSTSAGGAAPVAVEGNATGAPRAPCTGCVELVAPVSGANSAENLQDQVGYQFNVAAPGLDGRDARITWRLMSLVDDDNLFVTLYAQNGAPDYSNVYPNGQALNSANFPPGMWVDVTLDLSAYGFIPGAGTPAPGATLLDPGTFDKTRVESFGIQLRTGSTPVGTRAIRVLVDSVTVEGVPGQPARSFDSGSDGLGVNNYQVPLGTQPPLPH